MTTSHPRELLVLRHGKSSWSSGAPTDFERPLAKRGRRDAPRMGAWLLERDLVPDLVVSSPAARARETAEVAMEAMDLGDDALRFDERIYGAVAGELIEVLQEVPADAKRVMLVGHNPGFEDLVLRLASERPETPPNGKLMPTCALARLGFDLPWAELEPYAATLLSLVRPKTI